eukprot:6203442-Pleurochrysis_carterae.AAC.2
MYTSRSCLGDVKTCDKTELRQHDGPILDGRSADQFARQNSGLYGSVIKSFLTTKLCWRTRIVIYGGTAICYGAVRSGRQGYPI